MTFGGMVVMSNIEIRIEGIEATQATQFYKSERHLDAATAEGDNAVPLVAGKPLALRVYPDLSGHRGSKEHIRVCGELWYRSTEKDPWQRASVFPKHVLGQPANTIRRGDSRQSLNFRIPKEVAKEALWVRCRVWALSQAGRVDSDWFMSTFSFVETLPLRLRLYGVHYRGGGLDLPPPDLSAALDTLTLVRKTYPVPQVEVESYETFEFSGDLSEQSEGECGSAWRELLLLLSRLRIAGVWPIPYYALLPRGIPTQGYGGFGSPWGVGASVVGDQGAMAQELGHVFQRRHAPGQNAQHTDAHYPVYRSYASSSIGEYGFDPAIGCALSPRATHDFMSYGSNYWVSPYTYRALLEVFKAPMTKNPHAAKENSNQKPPDLYLHVGFRLGHDHRFELHSTLTLPDSPSSMPKDENSACRVELWDEEQRVVASQSVYHGGTYRSSSDAHYFFESIRCPPESRMLALRCCQRHDPVTWTIPQNELDVQLVDSERRPPNTWWEGVVDLRWHLVADKLDRLMFLLRYTWDGGRNWQPVNIGLAWRSCRVDLDRLPGGEDCRFQILASTTLQTATAETVPFRVRRKPRRARIYGGRQPRRLCRGGVLELAGVAHSPDGFASDSELVWTSNRQGHLGMGAHLMIYDLAAGDHEITLTAPDGVGGRAQDRSVVYVEH